MTKSMIIRRALLNSGSAFKVFALLGAGVVGSTVAAPVAAQDYTNVTASGRVQATDGSGIPGATVTVTSAQGVTRSVTTDGSGGYRIPQIPAGPYTFEVSAAGFDTYSEARIPLGVNSAANQFTLSPVGTAAATGDDIVVTAGRVQVVDFERTTTGAVIDLGELARTVPVARDINSVIQLSPGATAGDSAFGGLSNISGSSVAENIFYVNGLNITNFRTGLGAVAIPFDFYETVEIKNGGFQAEFGRTTGGVVNAVTKSGSNEFHGGVLFNWEPDALRDDSPNTLFADNDAREIERTDTIFQLSGPIIKDRLFVYGLYNARNITSKSGSVALAAGSTPEDPTLLGTQYLIDRTDSPFYGFKVDAVITEGHRLEGTFFDSRSKTVRNLFGTAAQEAAGGRRYNPETNDPGTFDSAAVFRSGGVNYVGRYTGQFTDWLTISGAYGRNKDRDTTESTTPGLASVIDQRGGNVVSIGNPTANANLNSDEREFYRGDVDLYFNAFGKHHIRAGYDRENLTTQILTQSNGIGQVTLADGSPDDEFGFLTGQYATVRTFRNGGEFKSSNEAFYIQDNWSLFEDRLTLQLGVRNDRFTNRNIAGVPFYQSGDQWGPRAGFTADPIGDGRTKIYGSFGRYFLPIAANTNNRLGGAEIDYDRFYVLNGLNADGTPNLGAELTPRGASACPEGGGSSCIVRSDGVPIPTQSAISQNLESQSVDEYILGIERRLGDRWRVGIFGTWRDLNASLEDAAVDAAVRAYCTREGLNGPNPDGPDAANPLEGGSTCQSIFNGTHQYVLLNPGKDATITLSDVINGETELRTIDLSASELGLPEAVRYYRAVTLQINREFDGVWGGEFSYTWSDLRGNTEGGVRSDNGQTDTGATVDFDLPGLTDGTYGFSPNHRRHNFKLYGSYKLTDWLTVGGNGSITSPRKFGCIGTVPSSRDPDAAAFYGANGTYCNLNEDGSIRTTPTAPGEVLPPRQIVQRGTAFESDWLYQLNLDASIRVPTDVFDGVFRVSVFNVFNSSAQLDFEERGTLTSGAPRNTYGQVSGYQAPRSVRLQLGVNF